MNAILEIQSLEMQRDNLIEQVARIKNIQEQVKHLDERMNYLRGKFLKNKEQIKDAEARTEAAKDYEYVQKRDLEITRDITRLYAKLEFGEQFQTEIANELCPIMSQKCLNSKNGKTLETIMSDYFVKLKTEIGKLENEQKSLVSKLKISRDAERISVILEALKIREAEISEEGKKNKTERKNLLKDTYDLESLRKQADEISSKLKNLHEQNFDSIALQKVEEKSNCNVGSRCLRIAEFLFSSITCDEVFYPSIGDWREDYINALSNGKKVDAVFLSIRNYFVFVYTCIIYSKIGKLIEFIMKLIGTVELFTKFFK